MFDDFGDDPRNFYFGHGWVGAPRDMIEHMYMRAHRGRHGRPRRDSEEIERREEQEKIPEEKDERIYFEDLLSFPKKLYEKNTDEDSDTNILSLEDFKKEKIDRLKEDIFYYCAPPEILNKLSKNIEDKNSYKINQSLNTRNFLFSQKIKNKILNDKETKLKNLIKTKNLGDYIKELPKKLSNSEVDKEQKEKEIENCSLISNKIDEISFNYNEKRIDEILDNLVELEKLIENNKISMKSLGFLTYNLFEISLCNLLYSIKYKIEEGNDEDIQKFGNILISINENVKSVKLLILLIQFLDSHKEKLNLFKIEQNTQPELISKNIINFDKLYNSKNIRYKIKIDYSLFWSKEVIKEKIKNLYDTNYNDYLTLHYEDNLFVFLNYKSKIPTKNKEEGEQEKYQNFLFYLKIDINEKNVVDYGQIELISEKEKDEEIIKDINISIKNEFIYIFYLTEKSDEEKYLQCKIYNQSTMGLIKEDKIDFKNYLCIQLINDNKYLYCICKDEASLKVLLIQKKFKLDFQKYVKLEIYSEQEQIKENNFSYKMYNCLNINNLAILELNNEKYISYFSKKNEEEYILNISLLNNNIDENSEEKKNIKLSYNNNRFLIIKIDKNGFTFNITKKETNNFIDEGLLLLPFDSNSSIQISYNVNIYEYLLQRYTSYLNLYGNMDLLTEKTENLLVEDNFIYTYNFKECLLDFLIKKIMDKSEENLEIKLYYFIILKQNICAIYNSGIFNEKNIKKLIDFLKDPNEFIFKNINENKNSKITNKILKEIKNIVSYINESNIFEIKDLKNYLDKGIDKTNFLLYDILLEQKISQKEDDLYQNLIDFDKKYLMKIFNDIEKNPNQVLNQYSLYKHITSKASEILFVSYFNNEDKINNLFNLLKEDLVKNIKEIWQLYINSKNNHYINKYSLIYYSFNFRLFYFIIQNIASKNIFIGNENQKKIKELLLFLDENSLKDINIYEYLDLNNIQEIKISSILDTNNNQEFEFEKYNNILVKTSFNSGTDLDKIINVKLINEKNEEYILDLNIQNNLIFKNFKKIVVNYLNKTEEIKNEIIIYIIPLKDEKNYFEYKKNYDMKMIDLIEKSIHLCLLNSYDKIQQLIESYEKEKLVAAHKKLYQNKILKYIDINEIEIKETEIKDNKEKKSELLAKSDTLIENIKNITKEEFNDCLIKQNYFDQNINGKEKEEETEKDEKVNILISFLEKYYSITKKININRENIKKVKFLIDKIFMIGIKYKKYQEIIGKFVNEIKSKDINKEDNEKILEIESIENFADIYKLYTSCFKMSSIFDVERNKFIYNEFEKEVDKYIDNINTKLDFIDKVISSNIQDKNNILPGISIIDNIFNLLKQLENKEIQEIIKYSEIQNINCNIMIKQIELIQELLKSIKKENNLSFLLNLMNQKIRMNHSKGRVIFDDIYGSKYSMIANLTSKFHEIIKIIYNKIKDDKNQFSNLTKYELLESLLWKIKERDLEIINEIIEIYLKQSNNNHILNNKSMFNLKYFGTENELERKKEIFEILISQIFNLKKEKMISQEYDNYKVVMNKILDYFSQINNENPYYHDNILLFYKNIFNSKEIFDLIISSDKKIFNQVMKIALAKSSNEEENDDINSYTKLIMVKLLYLILQTDNIEQLKNNLSDYLKSIGETPKGNESQFEILFNIFYKKLNKDKNDGKIIKRYYHRILIICMNLLIKEKKENKDDNSPLKFLFDKKDKDIFTLLFYDYYIGISENKYIINSSIENTFENTALYYSEKESISNSGKILCFIDQDNNSFDNYLTDNSKTDFDKNDFKFFTESNKVKNNKFCGFIISNDALNSELFKINSIDYQKDIILQEYNENEILTTFIKNNIKFIINIIIEKFSGLNDIGKYLSLQLVMKVLNQLDKSDIEEILKKIYEYYDTNKNIENKFKFLSFEYIEEKIYIILNTYMTNINDIYSKGYTDKDISNLFNFYIKGNSIGLSLQSSDIINWYKEVLDITINEENKEKIKEIYKDINVKNISYYIYNENDKEIVLKDDSVLFTNEISDKIIFDEIKNKNIRAIIAKEIKISEEDLLNIIKDNNIPIYKCIKDDFYSTIIEFFLNGEGGNYIDINNYESKLEKSFDIVNIFKFDNLKIEELNDENLKNKKYQELVDIPQNFYCLGNLKLIKRLILDLLCMEPKNFDDIKKEININEDVIFEILEVLNLEYYFNIRNNLPNENLKNNLIKYMNVFSCKLLEKYLDKYINLQFDNKSLYNDYLDLFDIERKNKEMKINEYLYNNVIFDKLLFILRNCINNSFKPELFIDKYFIAIEKILENKLNTLKDINSRYYGYSDDEDEDIRKKSNDYFEEIFAYDVFKILYEYIIKNYSEENSRKFKECFIEHHKHHIDEKMKNLIEKKIDMEEYFSDRSRDKIKKGQILLFQIIFIYFDFCVILFFRENEDAYLKYWMKTRHKLFLFYCNYKLLTTEKYYNENDFKEIFSLIAYVSNSIDCFNSNNLTNKSNNDNILTIQFNNFNKYTRELKDIKKEDDVITSFSIDFDENILKSNYNKLAVFILDKNNENDKEPKYIFQDIIDIKKLKRKKIDYRIKLTNDEIYLVPLKNVKTYLYAFGYNYNNTLGVNGSFAKFYDSPTKCDGLSQYSWNFSYGQNFCISLDEETNKISSSGYGKGAGLSSISQKFIENEILNKVDNIVDIATGNCTTSVVLTGDGEVYAIGKNELNFLKLKLEGEKTSLKIPIQLPIKNNIKIVSMSIGYKNCFVIDSFGELYGIGDNTRGQIMEDLDMKVENWTKIELPEGCKRFLQCANGERYLICLVEDYRGDGKLYARGINVNHECGIKNIDERYIPNFTQCDETYGLNFKSIYTRNNRSAAITTTGKLYIWGQRIITNYINTEKDEDAKSDSSERRNRKEEAEDIFCPTLVEFDSNIENAIIDDVAISNTHLLAIGRVLENGSYVKRLFACGNNKKGALGLKITSFSDKNMVDKLTEVKIDKENNNLIPIKLSIGNHRSFVLCIDEKELIEEINNNKTKKEENNDDIKLQIKINNYVEESMEVRLKDFYLKGQIDKFMNIFRALTNQIFIDFVDIMDKLKTQDRILTANIYYNEFLNFLNREGNIYDFLLVFGLGENNQRTKEQEKESIFNYLKTRMMLVENNIMKFCLINNRSEYKQFLQKIIANNIIYLPNKISQEKFNELLSEIPRYDQELKTIKVDRFKAKAFYSKYNESYKKIKDIELDETIFGQIFCLLKNREPKEFFLEKNSRLFRVALQNEHASDSGGPYHEVISNICEELQSDYLDVLIKTPNNKNNYDLLNDKYIINPNSSISKYNEAYEFLGKLMASSISNNEALDLNLHPVVWKSILSKEITLYDYESIDYYFYTIINKLEYISKISNKEEQIKQLENYQDLNFVIKNSNDIDIELKPGGSNIQISIDNLKEYIELCKSKRIKEFNNSLEYLKKGFYSVISYDIIQVLNWSQLEEMVCGVNKLDINEFKNNTEYEGFNIDDQNVQWFWEWFESASENERIKYLKFVSGRSRLSKNENGYKHIISKASQAERNGFPKSMTCFFKLNLPEYDSKEQLVEKMKYAILYCYEIDTDQ